MVDEAAGAVVDLGGQLVEFLLGDPPQGQGFLVGEFLRIRWGDDEESHVEVEVRILLGWSHLVDVDVDGREVDPESFDTRLLLGLTQGDGGQIGVAVGMTARLEPPSEFGVEHQQDSLRPVVDHECRAREMTGPAVTEGDVVMVSDGVGDAVTIGVAVAVESCGGELPEGDGRILRGSEVGMIPVTERRHRFRARFVIPHPVIDVVLRAR